ncbi:MAG: DUF1540 domain-containing protein [Deltaproteobacteria bacterium]
MHAEMPKINVCDVTMCVYNKEKHCNTIAITVGDAQGAGCPECDTMAYAMQKAGVPFVDGEVGACRQTDCKFNQSWECSAHQGIKVGIHDNHPDCMTYEPKK